MADEGMRARGSSAKGGSDPDQKISVVVPTYNETENIRPLCERLFKALKDADISGELLFADDESAGSDDTVKIVNELKAQGYNVRIHCRKRSEGKGLSSAVLLGFEKASHNTLICMDADLQHEPETVPAVAAPILEGRADFVVGSRNVKGGGVGFDWSLFRRILSWGATMLAWPVAASTDPMSGFFCTTKDVVFKRAPYINPIGFKIGLEIMARARCKKVCDVPISFQKRAAGESKLDGKMIRLYSEQLCHLYWDRYKWLLILLLLVVTFVVVFLANFIMQKMLL